MTLSMLPVAVQFLMLLSGGNSAESAGPAWEKVFELGPGERWISSVRAVDRDHWFVAGDWGVAWMNNKKLVRQGTPSASLLGMLIDSPTSVYAFGDRELVLHFDGSTWTEEHRTSPSKKPLRGEDELIGAYLDPKDPSSLVAFGADAVLKRQPDATWIGVPEAERSKLLSVGAAGPADIERPQGCALNSWFWLGRSLAWSTCRDHRTFVFEAGKVALKGVLPNGCKTLTSAASAFGEVYTICANHTLWRTSAQAWRPLSAPKDKDKDYGSISVTDHCVFLAGRRTVWRSCSQ
jgi:hypothetical protein